MKEVTYEDWLRNPTPRMMWVWDSDVGNRQKLKVIYVLKEDAPYPVITINARDVVVKKFLHCAEIEKQRRMTNKELSLWLREKPTRELKIGTYIYHNYDYEENEHDLEVTDSLLVREDDSNWREPLVEE